MVMKVQYDDGQIGYPQKRNVMREGEPNANQETTSETAARPAGAARTDDAAVAPEYRPPGALGAKLAPQTPAQTAPATGDLADFRAYFTQHPEDLATVAEQTRAEHRADHAAIADQVNLDAVHRLAVQMALEQGLPVRPEVLADYPELAPAALNEGGPHATETRNKPENAEQQHPGSNAQLRPQGNDRNVAPEEPEGGAAAGGGDQLRPTAEEPEAGVGKPLHEMNADELTALEEQTRQHDTAVENKVFGEAGAKKYRQLRRTANSATTPRERQDVAQAEMERMENALPPEGYNQLFGIGQPPQPDLEMVRDFRVAVESVDGDTPEELGRSIRQAVIDIGDADNPATMTPAQQRAYAKIRTAAEIARARGWDEQDVLRSAVEAAAGQFSDPNDAADLLQRFAGIFGEQGEEAAATRRGAPPGNGNGKASRALPAPESGPERTPAPTSPAGKATSSGANTPVTEAEKNAAVARLRRLGIIPRPPEEDWEDLLTVGRFYIQNGIHKFSAWSESILRDLGDLGENLRPRFREAYYQLGHLIPVTTTHIDGDALEVPQAKRQMKRVAMRKILLQYRGTYHNDFIGRDIAVNRQGIEESVSHATHNYEFQAIAALPQLLKNAIEVDEAPHRDVLTEKKSDYHTTHLFYAPLKIGDQLYLCRIRVNELYNRALEADQLQLYAIKTGKPTDATAVGQSSQKPSLVSRQGSEFSINTVSDLLDFVKKTFPEDAGQDSWSDHTLPPPTRGAAVEPPEPSDTEQTPSPSAGAARPAGMTGPLQSSVLPGAKPFVERDVWPKLQLLGKGVVQSIDGLRAWLAPQTRSPEARQTAEVTRDQAGDLARRTAQAAHQLQEFAKVIGQLPPAERLQFIDNLENGRPQNGPVLTRLSRELRRMLDERAAEVRALGPGHLDNLIENYFPHLWQEKIDGTTFLQAALGQARTEGATILPQAAQHSDHERRHVLAGI